VAQSKGFERFSYGTSEEADVNGTLVKGDNDLVVKWKTKISSDWNEVSSHLPGTYNFPNILAAIAIGVFFGMKKEEIGKGIESYIPTNNRSQVVKSKSNTILMDAYNANPSSVEAALENFGRIETGQRRDKTIILGEMLELGETSPQEHRHIIELVSKMDAARVYFVGNNFLSLKEAYPLPSWFKDVNELAEFLKKNPVSDSLILVKGSRGNKLEKVMEVL